VYSVTDRNQFTLAHDVKIKSYDEKKDKTLMSKLSPKITDTVCGSVQSYVRSWEGFVEQATFSQERNNEGVVKDESG